MTTRDAILNVFQTHQKVTAEWLCVATGRNRGEIDGELRKMRRLGLVRCERRLWWRLGR